MSLVLLLLMVVCAVQAALRRPYSDVVCNDANISSLERPLYTIQMRFIKQTPDYKIKECLSEAYGLLIAQCVILTCPEPSEQAVAAQNVISYWKLSRPGPADRRDVHGEITSRSWYLETPHINRTDFEHIVPSFSNCTQYTFGWASNGYGQPKVTAMILTTAERSGSHDRLVAPIFVLALALLVLL